MRRKEEKEGNKQKLSYIQYWYVVQYSTKKKSDLLLEKLSYGTFNTESRKKTRSDEEQP